MKIHFKKNIEFICPNCKNEKLAKIDNHYICENNCSYNLINEKPILIDFPNSLVSSNIFSINNGDSVVNRSKNMFSQKVKKIIFGENEGTIKNFNFLIEYLKQIQDPKILIVGGGAIGAGMRSFYNLYQNNIYSFDIYDSPNVDFIADAHFIPILENTFDLVIIQAVLEHVRKPSLVVSQIYRVLRESGLVYAETPFMQQVHEGPYDFTRFTESGHRDLFGNFSNIKSGFLSGAGTSLLWSLDYFVSGIFRSKKGGKIAKLLFFWLIYFDKLIPDKYNIDAASSVYFLGKKNSIVFENIVEYYNGAQ